MDAIKNIIEHSNQYTESFNRISLVAGGAGFVGSHLCNRLLDSGYAEVVCVDNLQTGSLRNIEGHLNNPRFRFLEHDIIEPFFLMIIPESTTFWNVLNAVYDLSRLNIRILSQMFL